MQQESGISSVWVLRLMFAILLGAVTLVAAQNPAPPKLPEGPGKSLVETRCSSCHGVDPIVSQKLDKAGWSGIVENMRGIGATLKDDEATVLVDYLVKSFGANSDAETKKTLEIACGSCHGIDLLEGLGYNKDEWTEVVSRMVAKGAELSDKQAPAVIDYLVKFYGPKKPEDKK